MAFRTLCQVKNDLRYGELLISSSFPHPHYLYLSLYAKRPQNVYCLYLDRLLNYFHVILDRQHMQIFTEFMRYRVQRINDYWAHSSLFLFCFGGFFILFYLSHIRNISSCSPIINLINDNKDKGKVPLFILDNPISYISCSP